MRHAGAAALCVISFRFHDLETAQKYLLLRLPLPGVLSGLCHTRPPPSPFTLPHPPPPPKPPYPLLPLVLLLARWLSMPLPRAEAAAAAAGTGVTPSASRHDGGESVTFTSILESRIRYLRGL